MEQSRIGWARSAVSRAAKRVGGTALELKFTLLCACVVFALAWAHAWWLLRVWIPAEGLGFGGSQPNLLMWSPANPFLARVRLAALTTALAVSPVFAAEAWLFLCRLLDARSARRLTVPFALVTAGLALLDIVVVRAIPLRRFILFYGA
jgi:Sec-independent protein secretion pathway component TatC